MLRLKVDVRGSVVQGFAAKRIGYVEVFRKEGP